MGHFGTKILYSHSIEVHQTYSQFFYSDSKLQRTPGSLEVTKGNSKAFKVEHSHPESLQGHSKVTSVIAEAIAAMLMNTYYLSWALIIIHGLLGLLFNLGQLWVSLAKLG